MSDLYIPPDPRNVPERPLSKGMVRHLPPQGLEEGAFLNLKNYWVTQSGLKRRGSIHFGAPVDTVDYPRMQGMGIYWTTAGSRIPFLMDSKFFYTIGGSSYVPVYSVYDTGTITATASDETITGASTLWDTAASDVKAGDIIVLDPLGAGNGPEYLEIDSITSDTVLETVTAPVSSHAASSAYEIRRAFGAGNPNLVDVAFGLNELYFTDGVRLPQIYDGSTLDDLFATSYIPHTVEYFKGRIWIANIVEGASQHRQRIRWGKAITTPEDFSDGYFFDLPYTSGAIKKLKAMGDFLIVYFEDAIFIGRTRNDPALPLTFQKIETGGVGLIGLKAVTEWMDGHFFVGQDDIYFLSNRGLERIGTPIVKETLEKCSNGWRIFVAPDITNDRIVFGFPEEGQEIVKLWSYNYKSRAWSYDDINADCLGAMYYSSGATWSDMTGTWAVPDYTTWAAAAGGRGFIRTLFIGKNDTHYYQSNSGSADDNTDTIQTEIVTRDKDYGQPDIDKVWTQLSMKLEDYVNAELTWSVEISVNRGRTWKAVGTLVISTNEDEGKVNFRMRGSIARFRLRSTSVVDPYIINEMVERVRLGGREVTE